MPDETHSNEGLVIVPATLDPSKSVIGEGAVARAAKGCAGLQPNDLPRTQGTRPGDTVPSAITPGSTMPVRRTFPRAFQNAGTAA